MSMSSHVTGVRDLDAKFAKMMRVKLSCEEAEVDYPQDVKDYFKYPDESEDYLRREMEDVDITDAVSNCGGDSTDGWEVDLSKLPSDVKAIRFENSY